MTESNKWGLQFTEIDHEKQDIKTLLYLSADEHQVKTTFESIKSQFKRNEIAPECTLDLMCDDGMTIVDDYPLTKMQLGSVAALLGFELNEECVGND